MFKITGKIDFIDDLEKDLRNATDKAMADTVKRLENNLRDQAQDTLNQDSFNRWNKGFSVDEIFPGTYVLTLEGNIANIVDKGWEAGEISKNIMEGPRATHNKLQKKFYVDVPIGVDKPQALDADGLMSHFRNKSYEFSNKGEEGKPATRLENRLTRRLTKKGKDQVEDRLKNIIESRKSPSSPSKFLVIKRVTNKTRWPRSPIPGPNTLESNPVKEIGTYFEEILEELL